ncbi:MAG: lasso peptide biosynthesis B2 protein [Rhodobacteraceae bacterium]|nr:lasso peptide biosynthesis B2 protein [Paracoccaceae bacterium]
MTPPPGRAPVAAPPAPPAAPPAPVRGRIRRLRRLRRLSRHEARLLAAALAEVLRARAMLWLRQSGALRARIARLAAAPPPPGAADCRAALAEVAWSVAAAARLVPGASCLTQALAGQALLARRGIAATVRLSLPAAAGGAAAFRPHAWLVAGPALVLGGTAQDYARHHTLAELPAAGGAAATPAAAAP